MRAQKFGTPLSDDAKKAARAERFGTPGGTKGSSSIGPTVVSKSLSLSPSLRSSYNVHIEFEVHLKQLLLKIRNHNVTSVVTIISVLVKNCQSRRKHFIAMELFVTPKVK